MPEPGFDVTAESVGHYLAGRLGEPVDVVSLKRTFPGMSQDTYLIRADVGSEATQRRGFVLRQNPVGGGIVPVPLRREWEIYVRLHAAGVPVAEPLWFDDDTAGNLCGRPLFVRTLVEGSASIPHVHDPDPRYDALREKVCREHAVALARLHTMDWNAAGLGDLMTAPSSPAESASVEIETWWQHWEATAFEPRPEVRVAFDWFRDNQPPPSPRVAFTKGNNGLGEEIWDGGRLAAFSDFEFSSIGDPCLDWGFCQGILDLWDREKTLRQYEEAAGYEIDRRTVEYYRRWTRLKGSVSMSAGLRAVLDGRTSRSQLVSLGLLLVGTLEGQIASFTLAPEGGDPVAA